MSAHRILYTLGCGCSLTGCGLTAGDCVPKLVRWSREDPMFWSGLVPLGFYLAGALLMLASVGAWVCSEKESTEPKGKG